jgi:hypothetical protein
MSPPTPRVKASKERKSISGFQPLALKKPMPVKTRTCMAMISQNEPDMSLLFIV